MTEVLDIAGRRVLMAGSDDPIIRNTRDVLDLLARAMGERAGMIAVPVDRLDPSFFQLRSGFAGELLQKLVNYRFKLAILGDISHYVRESAAFRDLVTECHRGNSVCFVADLTELSDRLAATAT